MEIEVNGAKYEKLQTGNENLAQVVEKIVELESNKILVEIEVDGTSYTELDNEMNVRKINSINNLKLKLQTSLELAFAALESCNSYIDLINEKISELTKLYQNNQLDAANNLFVDTLEIIDLYIQLITRIHNTFKHSFKGTYKKSETMKQLEIHLLSILKALLPAKERNDIIMLCDLLEYELKDNLLQWKIKALPELQELGKEAI